MNRPSWAQYFMGLAHYVSIRSHDEETKVGCVIVNSNKHVLGMGYNGFPQGCNDEDKPKKRPYKYKNKQQKIKRIRKRGKEKKMLQ